MAKKINNLEEFKEYLQGVMRRAKCHAPDVTNVILPLAGWLLSQSHVILIREYNGNPANMLWFWIGEKRYCFYYNHSNWTIELRRDSYKGDIIKEFNNTTPIEEITNFQL